MGPLDVADLGPRVEKALSDYLASVAPLLESVGEDTGRLADALASFVLDGGKRLRPAFCYWGWRGAGAPDGEEIVAAAASLELLHACALIHDDVMDGSDTRRGRPAVHRRFAALHRSWGWRGDPEGFGSAAAILLGDVALVWAAGMLTASGLPAEAVHAAAPVYTAMRIELMAGQYLDMLGQVRGGSVEEALRVARYKSAKYTIEGPLHLGGTLAGAPPELLAAYSAYGLPLGEAFQLRDDVLGVFGDPAETGKPAGDDLREGKRTALIAVATERATPAQTAILRRHLGDPQLDADGVDALRNVLVDTGALAEVEQLIERRSTESAAALAEAPVDDAAREVLADLGAAAVTRRL